MPIAAIIVNKINFMVRISTARYRHMPRIATDKILEKTIVRMKIIIQNMDFRCAFRNSLVTFI